MRITPLTGTIGAEVTDIDLRRLDDDEVAAVRQAVLDHYVLCFRGQELTDEDQIAFGKRLGELHIAPFGPKNAAHPEMTVLDQVEPKGEGADAWHTDNTFDPHPPDFTLLRCVILPERGGDTCFADMYAAYDALSEPMHRLIEGAYAVHDLTKTLRKAIEIGASNADLTAMQEAWPPVRHPVVRTHPETGRRALFVNGNFTTHLDGVTPAESEVLLPLLLDTISSPDRQCRVRWEPGTVLLWDNRCVQHYAVPDYTERRCMHRVTIGAGTPE
ncbi:MAG: TauD/TfdA family dioxygenase [Acidimicrobiales bacterium]|nr:TauD/TfdA family dioxygenase [Acidimicrobiales bacterium]